MMRRDLQDTIEAARRSDAFKHYLRIRDRVFEMLEMHQSDETDGPSKYWEEELAGFDYMLDATPLIVRKLREHCYHLTGLRSNEYRGHHAHRKPRFVEKLRALQQQDYENLFVPESPSLGGFGYEIDGTLINLDTLKYYECLIAMSKAGLLAPFRTGQRNVVMEIGGGWGALAYQFKTLFPNTCYIIVDLPQTLIFSAVYLQTLFPEGSVLIYGDKPEGQLLNDYKSYDFIFLPHDFFPRAQLHRVQLAINTVSFQEMTTAQVDGYLHKIADLECSHFYSLNKDRSPYNTELTAVSAIIEKYYELTEINVLDVPYTMLPESNGQGGALMAKALLRKLLGWDQKSSPAYEYRHLIGSLRPSLAARVDSIATN